VAQATVKSITVPTDFHTRLAKTSPVVATPTGLFPPFHRRGIRSPGPELAGLLSARRLYARNVRRLRPFIRVLDGELHPLILVEVAKTLPCDSRIVDEHIVTAVVGGDKSIPLGAAEPLDGAGLLFHRKFLLLAEISNLVFMNVPSGLTSPLGAAGGSISNKNRQQLVLLAI